MPKSPEPRRVPAIKVKQWLKSWDLVQYDPAQRRRKPEPHFYLFSVPAAELRSLCGIFRRTSHGLRPRAADLGIQRQHDPDRSEEIKRFVEFGYPWSTLSETKRKNTDYHDLRKPGWLPTAIVINILKANETREDKKISASEVINVEDVALDDLLDSISSAGAKAILTFPDHNCSNGLSGDEVREIASEYFRVSEQAIHSKFSTLGGVGSTDSENERGRAARKHTNELMLLLTPK